MTTSHMTAGAASCTSPNHLMRPSQATPIQTGRRGAGVARQARAAAVCTGIMACAIFAAVAHQDAVAQSIENDQYYIGDDGVLHIVGEVQNDVDAPLIGTAIRATIYDSQQNMVLAKESSALVNTIMPNMKGPFDIIITLADNKALGDMARSGQMSYDLELEYVFGEPKNQVIDVSESSLATDRHNNIIVTGTVVNRGDITANMVSVVATIYDDAGNVAAVTRVHTEPDYLRAGENVFFAVSIPDKEHASDASRYYLVAESEEYAAVPEFPFGTTAVFIGTFAAYVAAVRLARASTTSLICAANPR